MEKIMNIYTLSELESKKKDDIKLILKERGELLLSLVTKVIKNKKIKIAKTNKIHEKETKNLFAIKDLSLKTDMEHLKGNGAICLYLEVDIVANKKNFNFTDEKYDSDIATSHFNSLLGKVIDKHARILWTVDKVSNQDKLEMRLLFPDDLIIPEIVMYNEYKENSKNKKKAEKESIKQECQERLDAHIEKIQSNRFNVIKNNPAYFPESRAELLDFIKKSNKSFDKEAVKNIIKKYNDDEEIVIACIGLFNDSLFKYVSPRLQNDRDFVIKMVDLNVNILEEAPKKYLDDDIIMNQAIDISGYIIRVASERLRHDKDFCLKAIKSQADAYGVIPDKMKEDRDLLLEAMNQRGEFLMYSPLVKTDKQLLIKAFSNAFPPQSKNLLHLTSDEFKNDKEVALAAIKCNPENFYLVSKNLQQLIGDNDPVEYLSKLVNSEKEELTVIKSKKKKM